VRGSAPIALAPAGLEHAGDLGEHGWLVCAQVDDPVADDHVDRAGLHRHLLDVALSKRTSGKPSPRAVDVDRPAAARIAVPHGPVGTEVVFREDVQGEHVTGVEGQPEHAPAFDVFMAGPRRVAPYHWKIR